MPMLATRYALCVAVALLFAAPSPSWAHCDSLDGPVVQDARQALEKGDVTPVLKWVRPQDEDEIRRAFGLTMAARAAGSASRTVADRYLFETLVRIHRAGEGEAFTGLKPASDVDPGIAAADAALQSGSADALAERLSAAVREGIRKRFAAAVEARRHASDSVDAGRKYVETYVDYIHFVENVHEVVSKSVSHQHGDASREQHDEAQGSAP